MKSRIRRWGKEGLETAEVYFSLIGEGTSTKPVKEFACVSLFDVLPVTGRYVGLTGDGENHYR